VRVLSKEVSRERLLLKPRAGGRYILLLNSLIPLVVDRNIVYKDFEICG
jgi:hypothetical protein